jgi:hypothetical protein
MLVFKQLFTFLSVLFHYGTKLETLLPKDIANLNGAFDGKKVMTYQA